MSDFDELLDPGVKDNPSNVVGSSLPNANAVLTLGILSIVGCLLYYIPGLICGIIALSMYPKVKRQYMQDPARFEASFKNAKGGYVCAIIGTSLSAFCILIVVIALGVGASLFGRF
jgi:ABC-type phosphate transport system permease subunit